MDKVIKMSEVKPGMMVKFSGKFRMVPPWISGSIQRRKRIALFVKTAVTSFDKVALLK